MKKHILTTLLLLVAATGGVQAQRVTDVLDRGLVAVKTTSGVFCSWRIPAEEWYDVKYNIYRDGSKLNAEPLSVSNYMDAAGTTSSRYTVKAVVNGVEQAASAAVAPLEKNYMTIVPKHDPSLKSTYVPNDACCADVDGDGVLEILMKYDNESEISASYPYAGYNGEYSLFECLKLDGTVLWWVNCGPNMGDFQNNEQNIVGYDWDGDGRAEVVFRAADGTTIHQADGTVYTVGDPTLNYRGATGGGANWFMHAGKEYLLYVDGLTGKPYQCMDYPLPRLEDSENPNGLLSGGGYDGLVNTAWGDGYGHRSTKHFFGSPYLDGRKPSIFLARGIYTRHKMVAYDVDPVTHTLVERWRWNCTEGGSPWYGQGYHNYSVADVDWDGRDEIVFGSMVIDDNGKGLSTTGLGHGDSQHVGDFDPYTHGQEVFACNEDQPNNNFRDGTTSKIYYRTTGGNDDGRANMANFIDEYPGAQGVTSRDPNLVGGASHAAIIGCAKADVSITQNFRIYWDGDLCDESFDYNSGKNSQGAIFKARQGKIAILEGSRTNNDTKGTPCYQGDIFGDWREEVIMRDASNNIRIYTTDIPTEWRLYSLWHDHQYRNAMVWQMCGYNQTPHPSFFVGAFEGITTPPAPLTMTGRTEIANNGTIGAEHSGKHIIMCETSDMAATVTDGAAPYILTVNAPTWVQGNNGSRIQTVTYTHTLDGGALTGAMRLVKQGDGRLVMAKNTHTYTGDTEVWAGEIAFDGKLQGSKLWLNRFARLSTDGGEFAKGIEMNYGATLAIGSDAPSTVTTDELVLGFGSIVEIDLYADGFGADRIIANTLKVEKKDWINGPEHLAPIIKINPVTAADAPLLDAGDYVIGEIGKIEGLLSDIVLQGLDNQKKTLVYEDGKLVMRVTNFDAGAKTWSGLAGDNWDIDNSQNFVDAATTAATGFYPGDDVTFDDSAANTNVVISETLMPKSVTFANEEKNYTLSGEGSIVGATSIEKTGAGEVAINNVNRYTGGTYIKGGKLVASSFANNIGTEFGALGNVSNTIYLSNNAVLSGSASCTVGNRVTISQYNGTIETPAGVTLTLEKGVSQTYPGQILYKDGAGTMTLGIGNSVAKLVILNGTVNAVENGSSVMQLPGTVEFVKGSLHDESNIYSYSSNSTKYVVEEGNSGSLYLDGRCDYTGTLTGGGNFTVYATSVRNYLKGNWSAFTGTLTAGVSKIGSYDPDFVWSNTYGLPNATLNVSGSTNFNASGIAMVLGNLTGGGTITASSITVGSLNKAYSYTGSYGGNPAFTKVGTGDWKLTRAVSGLRSVEVKSGTISLGASNVNTNVLASPLTLSGDALMRGRGTVTSIVVKDGAILQPGYYSTSNNIHYGAVSTTGDLELQAGSTLALYIRDFGNVNNTNSSVAVGGKLTINGKIVVEMAETCTPKVGDELTLWSAGSFAGKAQEIVTPELPAGMAWDISGLENGTGVIKVVEAAGISDIADDHAVIAEVYTTDGMMVGYVQTTAATAVADVRALGLKAGVYLIRMISESGTETVKVSL